MDCKLNKRPIPPTKPLDRMWSIIDQAKARNGIRSDEELSSYLGISRQAVSAMRRGRSKLSRDRCKQLRKILRLTDEEYWLLVTL